MAEGGRKVALVTGGSRRIGAAISRALAKAGYEVVLTYRASAREGKSLAARIGGSAVPLDLSRPSTFGRFADRLGRKFGRLDLLVHNAAVFPRTPVDEATPRRVGRRLRRQPSRSVPADPGVAAAAAGKAGRRRGPLPRGRLRRRTVARLPAVLPLEAAVPRLAAGLRKALPPDVRVGVVRPGLVLPPVGFPAKRWERLCAEKGGRRGDPDVGRGREGRLAVRTPGDL